MQHKIRLHGIDAPETGQAFGAKAKEALAEKVHQKNVRVVWKEKDRYGRIVGDVWLGDRNINIEMVRDGWAWWYRTYAPKSEALEKAEAEAKAKGRGLWRDENPEPPWEFRKKERERRGRGRRAEQPLAGHGHPSSWGVLANWHADENLCAVCEACNLGKGDANL